MSDSVRPRIRQPTRLPRPWDSPGKNIGVGCHFLLQCMKVKSENEVAPSCLTLSDPMDCSPSGSSVHGIFQARVKRVLFYKLAPECLLRKEYFWLNIGERKVKLARIRRRETMIFQRNDIVR